MEQTAIFALVRRFAIQGTPVEDRISTSGHINKTHIIVTKDGEGVLRRYILQRINTDIFTRPVELMENVAKVTAYLRDVIAENGGDAERETMTLISALDGKNYVVDEEGGYWRVYLYVPNTVSYDVAETPEMFENAGYAFGKFQYRLKDYPAAELAETIPHFHDTESRYRDFLRAVEENRAGRRDQVKEEIRFVMDRAEKCSYITSRLANGEIPTRVTHNDTKLNNVLIDKDSGEALCVIDLDTVMPGSALYDFGDGIRFGASSAVEDERDLSKVFVRLDMYESYVKGFLRGCDRSLTEAELDALPMGAYIITLETGMRFLGDHLNGDTYFAIHREGHNLDRARTQLKLVADMESKMDEMHCIVEKYK
ncbi:MAG: aminoglycoside phosphotransferase family protein [Clostridia bacterium]|nr:aminoglycoside phosphotransferase family protein [Clostridia bacterium]